MVEQPPTAVHRMEHVRVNCLAPGCIATERLLDRADAADIVQSLSSITPLGRLGTAEEVARAAIYAVESEFRTGAIISVDGGITSGSRNATDRCLGSRVIPEHWPRRR